MTVSTCAMDRRTTLIFDSLLGAPPVTFATRRAASSVFSSLSCYYATVVEREGERGRQRKVWQ
jgi:hypothetical protein